MSLIFRFFSIFFKRKLKKAVKSNSGVNNTSESSSGNYADLPIQASKFGDNFSWGAAASAFQTEGAPDIDGKCLSIWDTFASSGRKMYNNDYASITTDFYNNYQKDIGLLKEMNFNSFRFSLSWPRILPEGTGWSNQKGIDFYNRVIDTCLKNNIIPWVTLYHWDLPQSLQDKKGWVNRDVIKWFEEYAYLASQQFGDRVKNWMVLNEPMAFTSLGYLFGIHAPGKLGFSNFLPSVHHAALCQSIGGNIIRETVQKANIGTTFSCSVVEPFDDQPKNKMAAKRIDTALNRLFIEPSLGLGYPLDDLPFLKRIERYIKEGDLEKMKFNFDFIGLQYYYRVVIKHHKLPPFNAREVTPALRGVMINEMGFEVYPKGIYKILKKYAEYPQIKKIVITESGVCYRDFLTTEKLIKDNDRVEYHQNILSYVHKARNEGIPVEGYFVWSLTDNFEWIEGTIPRFGLIYIDYKTQERIIKESGKWFKNFLNTNGT